MIQDGQKIVLDSFTNFKFMMGEKTRFAKLIKWIQENQEDTHFVHKGIEFINLIIHSANDMNFRVHLQYEFQCLGLEKLLDGKSNQSKKLPKKLFADLRQSEVDKIKEQLRAFEDNMMDVAVLQHDAESKINAEVKVETLHNRLADLQASIHDQEYEAMSKICELEKQLNQKTEDLEKMKGTGRGVYALPG